MANYVEYIKVGTGETWPVRDADAQSKLSKLVDLVYPVGSIYMSVNNISPDALFGGSWEPIQDRFLLSAGDTYNAGTMGGEAEYALTVDEMPHHNHGVNARVINGGWDYGDYTATTNGIALDRTNCRYANAGGVVEGSVTLSLFANTDNAGGGKAHNNMPPYLTVYMWKRIG